MTTVRHVLAIAWLAFVFLLIGASPAHFWLDSGEIAAAGAELGIMHPTGVPGYVPLLHLATLLPIGSLGFRMAVMSSACMAGAIALLLALLERRGAHWALLWCLGLWLPLALTLARSGRVVEIYAFGSLLLAATAWGFDPILAEPGRSSRRLIGTMAAVVGVWGFGDLRLALLPAVVLVWAIAWRRREPWSRWAPAIVVIASLIVLTLPLSSARGPVADWGDPQTLGRVWDHVQARSIRESFAVRLEGMGMRAWSLELRLVAERLTEDLGPFGLLLAAAALLFGLTRPLRLQARELAREPDYRLLLAAAWLVVIELIYAVAINPMGGRDRQTGAALVWVAALVIGLAIHRWTFDRPPLRAVLLPLLVCALWIPSGWTSFADLANTRSWAPHAWTRAALARTPSDALVLSQSDDLSAGIAAARVLEGARPDLVALPAQHLYRDPTEWQRADPRRARVWRAAASGEGDSGRVLAALSSWVGPVALESPGVAILAGIDLPGGGEPPLWQTRLPARRTTAPREPDDDPLRAAIDRWRGELVGDLDRERLADALALSIHGEFARSPESPLRWLQAERGYRLILDEVLADHTRSLVGLAAIRDRFGATDEAIVLTRAALERDPERPTALANLALYLSRDPATLDEARELAELAVELAADLPSTWKRLSLICRTQADHECMARVDAALDRLGLDTEAAAVP